MLTFIDTKESTVLEDLHNAKRKFTEPCKDMHHNYKQYFSTAFQYYLSGEYQSLTACATGSGMPERQLKVNVAKINLRTQSFNSDLHSPAAGF